MPVKALVSALVPMIFAASVAAADGTLDRGRTFHSTVGPHDSRSHAVVVTAESTLTISITGDGASDLDVFVYDEFGVLLGTNTDITDICSVTITPDRAGVLRIEVRNGGGDPNAYTLIVT